MRICSTYGRPHELSFRYDYEEVRMDVFDKVPDNVDSDTIITLCGRDASLIPAGFNGYVDNGTDIVHGFRSIRSYHDFKRTPDVCDIVNMFSKVQDIAKGAFTVRSFKDLSKLYEASQIIGKRHVLIGMRYGYRNEVEKQHPRQRVHIRLYRSTYGRGSVGSRCIG